MHYPPSDNGTKHTGRVRWTAADLAAREPTIAPRADEVGADLCHAVYTTILKLCSPSEKHRTYLREGYGNESADSDEAGRYGTLPPPNMRGAIVAALRTRWTDAELLTVPGIVEQDGHLQLMGMAGLLIAWVDLDGRATALQVRTDNGKKHYLSSRNEKNPNGPSPGTVVHVARPGDLRDRRVFVTEGAKKANVIAHRLGAIAVALPGHGQGHGAAKAVLRRLLDEEDASLLVLALDSDDPHKLTRPGQMTLAEQVEASRRKLARMANGMGWAVRDARWNHADGKGIDDLLVAGHAFALETYRPIPDEVTSATLPDGLPGLTSGTVTAEEKLGQLAAVMCNPSHDSVDKVAWAVVSFRLDMWARPPRADGRPYLALPLTVAEMAPRFMGASRDTVSAALDRLQGEGLIDHEALYVTPNGPARFPHDGNVKKAKLTHYRPVAPFSLSMDAYYAPVGHPKAPPKPCPACGDVHIKRVCKGCGEPVKKMTENSVRIATHERARADRAAKSTTPDLCGNNRHVDKGVVDDTEGRDSPPLRACGNNRHKSGVVPSDIVATLAERLQAWHSLERLDTDWGAVRREPSYRALVADDPDSGAKVAQVYYSRRASLIAAEEVRREQRAS